LHKAEDALAGALLDQRIFADAARLGTEDIDARTDIHADGDYRRSLLKSLIERALLAAQRTKK
jgi:CO/xanthine dehydrogenase FAD-binding subunit